MKYRFLFSLAICLLAVTGLACRRSIKTSSYIVHRDYEAEFGVSSQGTVRWVPEANDVRRFQVRFLSDNPCQGSGTLLQNPRDGVVTCHLVKNTDGVFSYVIEPVNAAKIATPQSTDLGQGEIFMRVDSCKMPCPPDDQIAKVPTFVKTDVIHIDCQGTGSTKAVTYPANSAVSPARIIQWTAVGHDGVAWTVKGLDAVCDGNPTIGSTGVSTCKVKVGASLPVQYDVSVGSCVGIGAGQLSAVSAPSR